MTKIELRALRKKLGYSQEKMSELFDTTQSYYSQVELGLKPISMKFFNKSIEIAKDNNLDINSSGVLVEKTNKGVNQIYADAKDAIIEELRTTNERLWEELSYVKTLLSNALETNREMGKLSVLGNS
jgi:transcriptional regulator with XRE-family HTH domain